MKMLITFAVKNYLLVKNTAKKSVKNTLSMKEKTTLGDLGDLCDAGDLSGASDASDISDAGDLNYDLDVGDANPNTNDNAITAKPSTNFAKCKPKRVT